MIESLGFLNLDSYFNNASFTDVSLDDSTFLRIFCFLVIHGLPLSPFIPIAFIPFKCLRLLESISDNYLAKFTILIEMRAELFICSDTLSRYSSSNLL